MSVSFCVQYDITSLVGKTEYSIFRQPNSKMAQVIFWAKSYFGLSHILG